jgi:cellulose synthase/poly-beta-1,6-N-acetylglucosamine synthase-like glycosyltransferase
VKTKSFVGNSSYRPLVSIIVPAYNEAIHVVRNVQNLLKCDYHNFEIVFVDDGSTDNTYSLVKEAFNETSRIWLFSKPNGGKSSALNFGIEKSQGEILVCIDADTQLQKDAISYLISSFTEENIAAVAGNVKAGNEVNFISKWQSIEYITSQNFDRRAFDLLNAITVIPGAIGAFRKNALLKIGGFSSDTLAEDCDLTINFLREGYKVKYNDKALAYTEVPETIKMFMKQRFRWSFGIMQNMWKHRDTLFNHNYKNLGYIALPNIILFHFILPVLSPFAELIMIFGIIGGFWQQIITYYILFLAFDFGSALLAFSFEKEKLHKLWLILPQRIIYRQLMYWVLIKSIISAIRGTLVGWGILKRTGKTKILAN